MIKGILFDLDMTLIDFITMKRMGTAEAATAMVGAGLDMELEKLRHGLFDFYLDYGIESDNWITDFLHKENMFEDHIEAAGISGYRRVKSAFLEPYPGVYPTFIQFIKDGIKLGIVTDAPKQKAHMRLYSTRLTFFFDVIITDAGKPKPEGFLKAVKELGLEPEEVLMVGDWPDKDIVGAHAAGVKSCLASYGVTGNGNNSANAEPDYEINRIEDLLGLVQKINGETA